MQHCVLLGASDDVNNVTRETFCCNLYNYIFKKNNNYLLFIINYWLYGNWHYLQNFLIVIEIKIKCFYLYVWMWCEEVLVLSISFTTATPHWHLECESFNNYCNAPAGRFTSSFYTSCVALCILCICIRLPCCCCCTIKQVLNYSTIYTNKSINNFFHNNNILNYVTWKLFVFFHVDNRSLCFVHLRSRTRREREKVKIFRWRPDGNCVKSLSAYIYWWRDRRWDKNRFFFWSGICECWIFVLNN